MCDEIILKSKLECLQADLRAALEMLGDVDPAKHSDVYGSMYAVGVLLTEIKDIIDTELKTLSKS